MRRLVFITAVLAGATLASAQMPPSISKPIDAARKSADAANARSAALSQQTPAKTAPAPAAKAPSKAPAAAPGKAAPAASQGKAPAGASAKSAAPQGSAAAPSVGDKARATAAATQAADNGAAPAAKDTNKITFEREVFTYPPREIDPFASPIETGAIRPLVADLRVVGIIFDPAGRNSVVVFRDMSTQQQYRAKPGQMLGRAKVAQIKPQEVILSIDEYGFSRQEVLKLNTSQTQQTKGKP